MPVNDIVDQLRREESKLTEQLTKIQQQERRTADELKQVQSALSALGEKPVGKSSVKSGKRAATKSDVIAAMADVLGDGVALKSDALKTATDAKLREQGRSLAGFALRFKEALREQQFVESAEGYRVTNEQPQPHQ